MSRLLPVVGLTVALAFATAGVAAPGAPVLRSANQAGGHVVVTFELPVDVIPGQIQVATSPQAGSSGLLLPRNVKLREVMNTRPDVVTGVARWETRATLPRGAYYVQVSGFLSGGVTGCRPRQPNCLARWSNVRRVVVVR